MRRLWHIASTPTAAIDPLKVQLRAYLERAGIKPGTFARQAKVPRFVIYRWLDNDATDILSKTYKKIAALLAIRD